MSQVSCIWPLVLWLHKFSVSFQKGKPVQKRKKKTSPAGKPAAKRQKAVEEGEEENFDKVMPPLSDNSDMVKVSPLDKHFFR